MFKLIAIAASLVFLSTTPAVSRAAPVLWTEDDGVIHYSNSPPDLAVPIVTAPAPDLAVPIVTAPAPDLAVPIVTAPAPASIAPAPSAPATAMSSTPTTPSAGTAAPGACPAPPAPPRYNPGLSYDPPITITKGGTYSGRWRSTTLGQTVITIATSENVVIEDSIIVGRGDLIKGSGGIVTIRNTQGFGLTRWAKGEAPGKFAFLYGSKGVIIENNYIEHVWGIDIRRLKGSGIGDETVRVRYNQFRNAESKDANTGHPIQLNEVNAANIEIAWNEIINEPFISSTVDLISIFASGGVQGSPLLIHNNYVQGSYPQNPLSGVFSGSGITVEQRSSWVNVHDNQVVSTTNGGLQLAGGHDIQFVNNRALSSGFAPDGRWIQGKNATGAYVWDWRRQGNFVNNRMANNTVAWNRKDASGRIYQNNYWFKDCAPGMCTGNRTYDPPVATLAMEAAEYELWKNIVKQACVRIGAQ